MNILTINCLPLLSIPCAMIAGFLYNAWPNTKKKQREEYIQDRLHFYRSELAKENYIPRIEWLQEIIRGLEKGKM